MPIFEIEGPDGQVYEVDAPDENSAISAFQGQSQPAAGNSAPAWANSIDAFGRGIVNGATFGFGDNLGAGARWLGGKVGFQPEVTYDQALQEVKGSDAALAQANPVADISGNITGAVGTGLRLNQAGLTLMGRGAPAAMTGFGGVAARTGVAAGEGAGYGALTALGNDQPVGSGAVIGGLLGAGGNLVGEGVSTAYRNIADLLARNSAANKAGVSPSVATYLSRTLGSDESLGPVGASNIAKAGKDSMMVDAGQNARQALDASITRGGPGANLARSRIDDRLSRGASDLDDALNTAMGKPGESLSREVVVYGDKTNPLSLMYKNAYSRPINYADPKAMEIESIIKNRVPKSAIDAANDLMRVEGVESSQILAKIADDGSVIFETLPDVRQLDYITRGLKEVADKADGQGKLGGTTAIGRAYGNLSRDIRTRLKEIVPEYETALNRAGTEIGKVNASEFGDTLLSDSITRSQVSDFVRDIPTAERNSLKQAVRQNIDDRLARVKVAFTDPNIDAREAASALKTMSSRSNREKLSAVLGEKQASEFFEEMDRILPSFELKASVAENSKTAARQSAIEAAKDQASPGIIGTVGRGEPLNAGKRAIRYITGQTDDAIRGREDAFFSEVADLLTRPSSQSVQAFQAMQNYPSQTAANQISSQRLAEILMKSRYGLYPLSGMEGKK